MHSLVGTNGEMLGLQYNEILVLETPMKEWQLGRHENFQSSYVQICPLTAIILYTLCPMRKTH